MIVQQHLSKKQQRVNFLNLPSWEILGSKETEDDYEITARPIHSLTARFAGKLRFYDTERTRK